MRSRKFVYNFGFFTREKLDQLKELPCKYHIIGSDKGDSLCGIICVIYPMSVTAIKKCIGTSDLVAVDKAGFHDAVRKIRLLDCVWERNNTESKKAYQKRVEMDVEKQVLKEKVGLLEKDNNMLRELVMNVRVGSVSTPTAPKKPANILNFLNEECRSAFSLRDFIGSIEIVDEDLMYMKDYGYVESVSRLLNRVFSTVDMKMRPIHCLDIKREIMYLKDADGWKKEICGECPTIDRMFRQISQLHRKKMADYYQGVDIESNAFEEKARVMYQIACAGGTDEETCKKKIIKKIIENIRLTI